MNGNRTLIFNVLSQKGGCGKTAVSLLITKLCGDLARNCLILDVDFTGTSLFDLLESKRNEKATENEKDSRPKWYLEDLITSGPFDEIPNSAALGLVLRQAIRPIPAAAGGSVGSIRLDYIPSMSGPISYRKIAPFLAIEEESRFLVEQVRRLVLALRESYKVFVVDNAPGIGGLSRGIMLEEFMRGFATTVGLDTPAEFHRINLHVTGGDRQDAKQTFDSYFNYFTHKRSRILEGTGRNTLLQDKKHREQDCMIEWLRDHVIVMNRVDPTSKAKDAYIDEHHINRIIVENDNDFLKSQRPLLEPKVLDRLDSVEEAFHFGGNWPGLNQTFAPVQFSTTTSTGKLADYLREVIGA